MPPASIRTRLKTATAPRRLLGRRLLLARARAKGERLWANETAREQATATMAAILAGSRRSGELEELSRRRLVETEASNVLFWGPWRISEVEEGSRECIEDALSSGRRVILSTCHLGPFFLTLSPITTAGTSTIAVSGRWLFAEPTPDYWGRRQARWLQGVADRGGRLVASGGSFEVLRGLVERGEVVALYFDLPGSIRTDFLGKTVMLASGTSQLAHQTDALVLPLRARRDGVRVWTDAWKALDPRAFPGPEELHRALATVHERSILEMPEALEDPARTGAWEHSAGLSEWARPSSK
jgi:hypothetical protein